jgi:uncharacterized protein YdcH (DUF465 family)
MKSDPSIEHPELMTRDYPMGIIEQLAAKEAELQEVLAQADRLKQQIYAICQKGVESGISTID